MKSETVTLPNYATLIEATFNALRILGGSGKNNEIKIGYLKRSIKLINL